MHHLQITPLSPEGTERALKSAFKRPAMFFESWQHFDECEFEQSEAGIPCVIHKQNSYVSKLVVLGTGFVKNTSLPTMQPEHRKAVDEIEITENHRVIQRFLSTGSSDAEMDV